MKLTVFFDGVFWAGIFENEEDGKNYAVKHVFYSEPKEQEIQEFILAKLEYLKFGAGVEDDTGNNEAGFKRRMKLIKKSLLSEKHLNKSREIIKKNYEEEALNKKALIKEKKILKAEEKYLLKQRKKKEKRAGH